MADAEAATLSTDHTIAEPPGETGPDNWYFNRSVTKLLGGPTTFER